ncbi:endonuclease/exonuclease/phosphatase family protein [Microcoleus sp. FACHB-672]|uniref:endonuclease/exonuclease/phosphatase family protein n=1 Tax=Microcoleus sp. FACHB-672 TaxID=2692825 RepID=UPI001683BC7B|nr:endonuclease/exonuclease/phosphatase family protein [Microcoleus sp. FACHB-672]MBD2042948.1 endonuclease/exonuclease/phosphatase family protein [Microcoleus sp. FACHB-672]
MKKIPSFNFKPCQLFKRLIQLLVYAYSLFIISYFIFRFLLWDGSSVIALIGIMIPLILLPTFLLPIWALLVKKRRFFIFSSIACIWLLSWLYVNYASPESVNVAAFQTPIKVLTFNNYWNRTSSQDIITLIEQQKPDLLFLQETTEKHEQKTFPTLKLAYPYHASAPSISLFSKYPIQFAERLHLAGHKQFQQRAIIRVNQQDIVIYNIQLTSPWIQIRKTFSLFYMPAYVHYARTAETKDLVQRLQKESLPMIVAGDFNMTDQSQDYHSIKKILKDSFLASGLGFGFTWPHGWDIRVLVKKFQWKLNLPLFRIDYIWYSKDWISQDTEVLHAVGSDHLPVETSLFLRGK